MNIEKLALKMRLRAIAIENEEAKNRNFEEEKKKLLQQQRLDSVKKLYFHAGRWAGGARDKNAREAFEKVSLTA
jgi:hypothetical protein